MDIPKLEKQEYFEKPLYKKDVRGSSSKAIFKFMTTDPGFLCFDEYEHSFPVDSDDFERNRALLLWYPEWKERLSEMSIISDTWSNLVNNWDTVERLYNEDYEKYGSNGFNNKSCCSYIKTLIK